MNHEAYKEMLPLAALGALDGEEARAFGAHLETCAECRAEVEEMRDASALLAHAAAPVRPPEQLRARILSSVGDSPKPSTATNAGRETPARTGAADATTGEDKPPASGAASNVLPFEAGRKPGAVVISKPLFAFGAVAASLVIVALAAALLVLRQSNEEMRGRLAALTARADELAARAERSEQQLARDREEREMLTAAGMRMVTLAGTKAAPQARATVAFDPRTGRALLLAADLPPAPAGKAYQLWFIPGGHAPMPGKVFSTDDRGRAALRDQMPAEAMPAPTFAVTLEPAQGVAAPTGEPYLVGKAS